VKTRVVLAFGRVEACPDGTDEREWRVGSRSTGKVEVLACTRSAQSLTATHPCRLIDLDGYVDISFAAAAFVGEWKDCVDVGEADSESEAGGNGKGRA